MGWKTNPVVGAVAVVLVVLGVAGIWWYFSGGGSAADAGTKWGTFRCKSTDEHFVVSVEDMKDRDTFIAYSGTGGQDVKCEICGGDDAIRIYYDSMEDKWYDYALGQDETRTITSPAGNLIPEEDW